MSEGMHEFVHDGNTLIIEKQSFLKSLNGETDKKINCTLNMHEQKRINS